MNFNFQIKNFGQIEDVKVPVRPFTVIAGPNASGKSFFTKSLYSFLKIAKQDHLPQDFSRSLEKTSIQLALLSELLNLEEDEKLSSITKKEIDFRDISKKIEEAKRDLIANEKSDNKSQEPYRVKDMQALTIL
ncbi:MAG: AAA family ATPase, partial [Erysipelotrichia bacterium]|nr:AAA family ATPase [Erysipelotrichia bacterium]